MHKWSEKLQNHVRPVMIAISPGLTISRCYRWSITSDGPLKYLLLGSTPFPCGKRSRTGGSFWALCSWFCGSGAGNLSHLIWALTHMWLGMQVLGPQRTQLICDVPGSCWPSLGVSIPTFPLHLTWWTVSLSLWSLFILLSAYVKKGK